jgi:hypothetical protein
VSGAVGSDRRDRDRDLKKAHAVFGTFLVKVTGLLVYAIYPPSVWLPHSFLHAHNSVPCRRTHP